jgi:dihydroorotase
MALTLTNFRAVAMPQAQALHVGDHGLLQDTPAPGAQVIDCGGQFLSPGWCDLHVHVWHGGTDISVRAAQAGRAHGVTAMADAGSAGEANFHGLREYVIDPAAETIRAFLNIGSIGLVACNRVSELIDMRSIDVDRTLAVIEANRDVICGIKVRASGVIVGAWGITPAKIAKRIAEMTGLPLMVHVGEPPPLIDEIFDILTPGDIVTHCFNGKKAGSIRDTAALFKQAQELSDQGVRMDIGHGQASFCFATARAAIADGLKPWSISTDLH